MSKVFSQFNKRYLTLNMDYFTLYYTEKDKY